MKILIGKIKEASQITSSESEDGRKSISLGVFHNFASQLTSHSYCLRLAMGEFSRISYEVIKMRDKREAKKKKTFHIFQK